VAEIRHHRAMAVGQMSVPQTVGVVDRMFDQSVVAGQVLVPHVPAPGSMLVR